MRFEVNFHDSPQAVLSRAQRFLNADPILNNLVITLLTARAGNPEPGRYWIASLGDDVVAVALQSPPAYPANVIAAHVEAAGALAEGIAAGEFDLPGVSGEARIAARFAGHWAEQRKTPAYPAECQRICQLSTVLAGVPTPGRMRQAGQADRQQLCDWVSAFQAEADGTSGNVAAFVTQRISAGEFWLWDDNGACCMAAATAPVAGVTRIQYVYTPEPKRRMGYAEALVRSLSQHLLDKRLQPMLFTDLANPTSHSVYRRIGYRAVGEMVRFRFATPGGNGR